MKRILIAAAALSALAGAAVAQPAYHGQGGPPPAYPPCSHPGQDRCAQHGWGGWHGEGHHGWGHHWHHHHHSSTDGERG